MEATQQFTIGSEAMCVDGICGDLSRVVVDPIAKVLTHLVVEPKHRRGMARLVPLDLVDASTGDVQLRCTMDEFDKLDPAEETEFLPGGGGYGGYMNHQAYSWPYYGLGSGMGMGMGGMGMGGMGMGGMGMGGMGAGGMGMGNATQAVTRDVVPDGEVAVRRGEQVHASDGDIGKVQGLVIDPHDHHVTHVLLQEGHLWGRKEVAIPIAFVTRLAESSGIGVRMTKEQVGDLPPVAIDHPSE